MNSEKVKEIKKALEERTQHKPINCNHSEYIEACGMYCRHHREFVADMGSKNGQTCENCNEFTATDGVKEDTDILTYISELESENERLDNLFYVQRIVAKQRLAKLEKAEHDRDRYQRRIVELEKENAKLLDSIETVQNNRCMLKCELTKKQLKQFAERLKEKLKDKIGYDRPYVMRNIDDTLKEFLDTTV